MDSELEQLKKVLSEASTSSTFDTIKEKLQEISPGIYQKWEENDFNINYQFTSNRFTLLHLAVKYKFGKMLQNLLDRRANANLQDKNGKTPLHLLASVPHNVDFLSFVLDDGVKDLTFSPLRIIEYLAVHGADVNLQDKDGNTPLNLAVKYEALKIAEHLVAQGADVNLQDKDGNTPLHWAVMHEKLEIIKCFVERGANIGLQCKSGTTPLSLAFTGRKLETLTMD